MRGRGTLGTRAREQKPRHWDIDLTRDFMLFVAPSVPSSIFGPSTCCCISPTRVKRNFILLVCRIAGDPDASAVCDPTLKHPLRSRPSVPLTATCLTVVAIGIYLPFSPISRRCAFRTSRSLPGLSLPSTQQRRTEEDRQNHEGERCRWPLAKRPINSHNHPTRGKSCARSGPTIATSSLGKRMSAS